MSILNPLYDAVAWIIMRIHAVLAVPFGASSGWAWGLSIVILVILMRLLLLPLFIKQVRSQRKMLAVMPQLQELRKRYKNDRQKLSEETMKFYKENGVNPLGGCLPLLGQFPVFISLFSVLRAISEWQPGQTPKYGLTEAVVTSAKEAHIFGVSLADKFLFETPPAAWSVRAVILVTVAVSACTTYLTMRQSSKRGMMQQPTTEGAPNMQKYMMYIAPFFALTGLYWQYGLVLYWVTTNIWTLGQQHFMFRNMPIVDSTGATSAVTAANGKSGGKTAGTPPRQAVQVRKPAAGGKAAGAAGAKSAGAKPAGAKPAAGKPAAGKAAAGKSADGRPRAESKPGANGKPRTESELGPDNEPIAGRVPADDKPGVNGRTASAGKRAASDSAAGKQEAGKQEADKQAADKQAADRPASRPAGSKQPAGAKSSAGAKPAGKPSVGRTAADGKPRSGESGGDKGSGRLGGRGLLRLGKKEPEPEPEPETVQYVRQQPTRQSRSKRSGKR